MDDADSLAGQTLAPVYKNNPNLMTFMYNDEKPEGPTSFDLGHTKVDSTLPFDCQSLETLIILGKLLFNLLAIMTDSLIDFYCFDLLSWLSLKKKESFYSVWK